MRKVVVTGMGMITALGSDLKTTWENMQKGKSGVSLIERFDTSQLETKIAAMVNEEYEEKAKTILSKRHRKQMTRVTRMLLVAAEEAIAQSETNFETYDKTRIGTFLGVIDTGYDQIEKEQSEMHMVVKTMANAPAAWLTMRYGLEGPSFGLATACASSAYAISLAQNMIQSGLLDAAIVGGTDSHVNPEYLKGFNQILAMSTRNDSPSTASRPFSKSRDGFVMGEGAGVMVLEAEDTACSRGANIYAELAGSMLTSEAADILAPKTDGEGMAKTMRMAMQSAHVQPNEIDYINAHGTSTYLNDRNETLAIKNCFGEHAKNIAISSSKSMIGHTLGASGAIEGIVTVMSLYNGILTPTINYEEPDEQLDLDYIPNKARKKEVKAALSNSFGFGGHNATLVFRKYEKGSHSDDGTCM